MKKTSNAVALAMLGIAAALPATASTIGFTGDFAPATWTTTIVGSVAGGNNGSVNTAGAPGSIAISDGNDPTDLTGCIPGFLQCELRYSHVIGGTSIAFNWAYISTDSGGAQLDQFGIILDGVAQNLSDPGGAASQSGAFKSSKPLSSFAFFFNCGDCSFGNATATISGLVVPEPASLALVGIGLAGIGLRRKPRA